MCFANQWTGFDKITAPAMKELSRSPKFLKNLWNFEQKRLHDLGLLEAPTECGCKLVSAFDQMFKNIYFFFWIFHYTHKCWWCLVLECTCICVLQLFLFLSITDIVSYNVNYITSCNWKSLILSRTPFQKGKQFWLTIAFHIRK